MTTAGCVGCDVTTAGIPVMTPSELVIDVYIVNGFSYDDVGDQVTSVVDEPAQVEAPGA